MSNANLDDIILPTSPKLIKKNRSILTFVALSIIMVIIIIILQNDIEEVSQVGQITQKEETPPTIIASKAVKEIKNDLEEELVIKHTLQERDATIEEQSNLKEEEELVLIEEASKEESNPIAISQNEMPLVVQPIKTITPKPLHQASHSTNNTLTKNYYIQIGSYKKIPSKRFLSGITAHGFKYTFHQTQTGLKKLLIGPYHSKSVAKAKLTRVKDTLNKHAFLITK